MIKRIILGTIEGIIFYAISAYILPYFVSTITGMPIIDIDHLTLALLIGVFISLGVISSSIKPCIGVIFTAISFLLSLFIILNVIGMGIAEVRLDGVTLTLEFKLPAFLIIGFYIIIIFIRVFEKIFHLTEI
ncbi:MAG: hypothetical protein QXS79_00680 [Candidatus Bathyarchaeia archaeon]